MHVRGAASASSIAGSVAPRPFGYCWLTTIGSAEPARGLDQDPRVASRPARARLPASPARAAPGYRRRAAPARCRASSRSRRCRRASRAHRPAGACIACSSASRARCSAITSSGARATKSALPSFFSIVAISFLVFSRSFAIRFFSAPTSMSPPSGMRPRPRR